MNPENDRKLRDWDAACGDVQCWTSFGNFCQFKNISNTNSNTTMILIEKIKSFVAYPCLIPTVNCYPLTVWRRFTIEINHVDSLRIPQNSPKSPHIANVDFVQKGIFQIKLFINRLTFNKGDDYFMKESGNFRPRPNSTSMLPLLSTRDT